jgi:hypothetical protein
MIPVKRILNYEVIWENDKALLVKGKASGYETWIKIRSSRTGQLYEPADSDFGLWAWSHYSLERAKEVFEQITSGVRTVRVMQEAPEVTRELVLGLRN